MTATLEAPRTTHRLTLPQIARLVVLARAGLSDAAVAIVMNTDYGFALKGHSVRYFRQRYSDVRHEAKGVGLAGVATTHGAANFGGSVAWVDSDLGGAGS